MNIKSIVKNQKVRHRILKLMSWLPDRVMLSLQYKLILNRWPNLKSPQRFTEWIQYYKMHYRNKGMLQCVDKFKVRDFVSKKFGNDDILTSLYQICDSAEEIKLETLPQKFVIKTTDGGNGDNVLIVRDKNELNNLETIRRINSWKGKEYYKVSREWAYKGAKVPRIIVEELLEDKAHPNESIDDFKFLCFNGKFKLLWIDKGRFNNHCRGFWNNDLMFLPNVVSDHPTFEIAPELPYNIRDMVSIAEVLSADFPFVRVDLYNIDGKIYFGEMTFYPWSGYVQFSPDIFDFQLGKEFLNAWNLNSTDTKVSKNGRLNRGGVNV